jgi:hypothetical protein
MQTVMCWTGFGDDDSTLATLPRTLDGYCYDPASACPKRFLAGVILLVVPILRCRRKPIYSTKDFWDDDGSLLSLLLATSSGLWFLTKMKSNPTIVQTIPRCNTMQDFNIRIVLIDTLASFSIFGSGVVPVCTAIADRQKTHYFSTRYWKRSSFSAYIL